jgi:hypothetical protein
MQVANSLGVRPESVTVISIFGIICSGIYLFVTLLFDLPLVLSGNSVAIVKFVLDFVLATGYLTACILMFNLRFSGKVLYHVLSVIWFLYMCFIQLALFGVFTVAMNAVTGFHNVGGSMLGVMGGVLGIVQFLVFLFMVITVVVFNVMLCSREVAACWKR